MRDGGARGRPGPRGGGGARSPQAGPAVPHSGGAASWPRGGERGQGPAPAGSPRPGREGEGAPERQPAGDCEGSVVLLGDQNKGREAAGRSAGPGAAAVSCHQPRASCIFVFSFKDIVRVGCVCSSAKRAAQRGSGFRW